MASVPVSSAADYACADADVTYRLMRKTEPELRSGGLDRLFADVEMPLVAVSARMEMDGVAIDSEYLRAMSVRLGEQLADIEDRIYCLGRSPVQHEQHQAVGGRPVRRARPGVEPSDEDRLQHRRGHARAAARSPSGHRADPRKPTTRANSSPPMSTRCRPWSTQHGQTPHVVQPDRRFDRVAISSSDPNLQNIPIRTPVGREVRRAFVAEKAGWSLLSADYSQVELRILAHVTQDANLVQAFTNGEDIHSATASLLFGVPLAECHERSASYREDHQLRDHLRHLGLRTVAAVVDPASRGRRSSSVSISPGTPPYGST